MKKNDTAYQLMLAFVRFNRQRMKAGPIAGLLQREHGILRRLMWSDPGGQGVTVTKLSEGLRVSAPYVTQTVNGLEEKGLVERTTDPEDRRLVRIRVTPRGREALRQASAEFAAHFAGLVEHLGEEESRKLTQLLLQVADYFERRHGKGGGHCCSD